MLILHIGTWHIISNVTATLIVGYAVEEIKSGEWDLTLFTCTFGGQYRVTIRCEKV